MAYLKPVKCPKCGYSSDSHVFRREWTNQSLIVNEVSCGKCGFKFRVYFGEKGDGSLILYTIPKSN